MDADITRPLVSIVMPAYNMAGFITETIASVTAQTYPNWELVIVDDGSTDSTHEVVEQLGLPKNQLNYLKTANGGPGAARNTGIKAAKGELVAFLDADDMWEKTKLEKQVAVWEEHHPDLIFSSGSFIGEAQSGPFASAVGAFSGPEMFDMLYPHNRIPLLSVLATKTALLAVGGFKETGLLSRKCEDYDLWLRMAKNGCHFIGLPDKLVGYRIHAASSTKTILIMTEAELAVVKQYDELEAIAQPVKSARMIDLYNRLAAAAASDGELKKAGSYLNELGKYQPVSLKRLALGLLGHYYAPLYYRLIAKFA